MNRVNKFCSYVKYAPKVPVVRIAGGDRPVIHRFFDSNPISPSGRYIALTEFPFQDRLPQPGDKANVVVIDLETTDEVFRQETAAWDTQVGAQVQWGANDKQLFFNVMDEVRWRPYGLVVDIFDGSKWQLGTTIYHVSSDGKFGISPDLIKINVAQPGYGVHVPADFLRLNHGTPSDDGIFISDIETGEARLLVSLSAIAEALADQDHFPSEVGSLYSFHTKWNFDASRIMFIARWIPKGSKKSRNWLITMRADGTDIRVAVPPQVWGHGHHPNWFPSDNRIVMNLPENGGLFTFLRSQAGRVGRKLRLPIFRDIPLRFRVFNYDGSGMRSLSRHQGSGHPTIHPSGKFLLSDSYLSEQPAYRDGTVPLRTIDLETGAICEAIRIDCKPVFMGAKKEYRIDPHPAWETNGNRLVFNGAVDGVRAVFIADFSEFDAASPDTKRGARLV